MLSSHLSLWANLIGQSRQSDGCGHLWVQAIKDALATEKYKTMAKPTHSAFYYHPEPTIPNYISDKILLRWKKKKKKKAIVEQLLKVPRVLITYR